MSTREELQPSAPLDYGSTTDARSMGGDGREQAGDTLVGGGGDDVEESRSSLPATTAPRMTTASAEQQQPSSGTGIGSVALLRDSATPTANDGAAARGDAHTVDAGSDRRRQQQLPTSASASAWSNRAVDVAPALPPMNAAAATLDGSGRSASKTAAASQQQQQQIFTPRRLFHFTTGHNTGSRARDLLALERTFLAMVRTGIAAVSLGVAVAKLINTALSRVTGTLFILLGLASLVFGLWRYYGQMLALERGYFAADTVFPWLVAAFMLATSVVALVLVFA